MTHAVLADDLTGAAEVAALLGLGVSLQVPTRSDDPVHDLHLRHLGADEARRRLADALFTLGPDADVSLKIDSQLNGPLAGYLLALLDTGRHPVVCAASPSSGRRTVGGVHHVPGPDGITTIAIRDLLTTVPYRFARGTIGRLGAGTAVVLDAEDAGDLRRLAHEALALGGTLVGSAAFLGAAGTRGPLPNAATPSHVRRLLVVVGSTDPVARAQIDTLVEARPGIRVAAPQGRATQEAIGRGLLESGTAVLSGGPGAAAVLADAVADIVDPDDASLGLLLTGGHTARTVLDRLGVQHLRTASSPVAGVAALTTPQGRLVLTKPGSYGSTTAIRDIARALLSPTITEPS